MSWISSLYDTYENIIKQGSDGLLPISHSTQNAHIEVTLNENAELIYAQLVDKNNSVTLIPVTESSAGRSSGIAPHALCDKIQYIAKDYKDYVGEDNSEYFEKYMNQLKEWCESEYANEKARIIYEYLKKGTLVKDLIQKGVLAAGENGKLLEKFNANFSLAPGEQKESFVRFRVVTKNSSVDAVWQDDKVIEDYINYYISTKKDVGFCYANGNVAPYSDNHPAKIRHSGDKAKLISSNDTSNFTFKGRFHSAKEAATVSYEVSQKAHNALKWLIQNQGQKVGDKVFVLWGTENEKTPNILGDTLDVVESYYDAFDLSEDNKDLTKKKLAEQFNMALLGYKAQIRPDSRLALIGLDSATTGRMSIIFYREYHGLEGHELIENIEHWHKSTAWNHRYKYKDRKVLSFYGAPSFETIATTAYGTEQNGIIKADSKIMSNEVKRLLNCEIDRRRIPRDIVKILIEKAKQPQNYQEINNWYKVLTVACSVYRKYLYDYKKEEYSMEIKKTNNLAYNCGRLLAVADAIETWALKDKSGSGDIRTTNAIRYFTRFSMSPCSTWAIINNKLVPYKQSLGAKGTKLYKLLGEISSLIDPDEFEKASNLDGCMVLGFDAQRQALYEKKTDEDENINEEE